MLLTASLHSCEGENSKGKRVEITDLSKPMTPVNHGIR